MAASLSSLFLIYQTLPFRVCRKQEYEGHGKTKRSYSATEQIWRSSTESRCFPRSWRAVLSHSGSDSTFDTRTLEPRSTDIARCRRWLGAAARSYTSFQVRYDWGTAA